MSEIKRQMLVSGWVIVVALFPQLATAKVRTLSHHLFNDIKKSSKIYPPQSVARLLIV
jgi:hypothetical protein